LANKVKGNVILNTPSVSADIITTISNDTLNILVTNYVPLAFIEAFNHTLFEGQFNANQLDSAGYINIVMNDLSHLDSIYQGLITIPNTNPINIAINNSIPIYNHFNSLQTSNRQFNLNVIGLNGVHSGINYMIDSTSNNSQFKYDSLLTQGFNQANAISNITTNQSLVFSNDSLINGQNSLIMEPNSIQLFQFIIPEIVSIDELNILIYPNPTENTFIIESEEVIGEIHIYNVQGKILESLKSNQNVDTISLSEYASGVYVVKLVDLKKSFKVIRK
jgi:hypothetical protein